MSQAPLPNPFPGHRDLYLIVAGLIVGVLCSSAVLGRLAPSWYDGLFVGSGAQAMQQAQHARERIKSVQQDQARTLATLKSTGVTGVAVEAATGRFSKQLMEVQVPLALARRKVTTNRQQYAATLGQRMTALILVMLIIMVLESLVAPEAPPELPEAPQPPEVAEGGGAAAHARAVRRTAVVPAALGRLVTIRYALAAIWIGMAIARPSLLLQTPIIFAALLLLVALFVGFVPLGPRNPRLGKSPR